MTSLVYSCWAIFFHKQRICLASLFVPISLVARITHSHCVDTGSIPVLGTLARVYSSSVEHWTANPVVACSIHARPFLFLSFLLFFLLLFLLYSLEAHYLEWISDILWELGFGNYVWFRIFERYDGNILWGKMMIPEYVRFRNLWNVLKIRILWSWGPKYTLVLFT